MVRLASVGIEEVWAGERRGARGADSADLCDGQVGGRLDQRRSDDQGRLVVLDGLVKALEPLAHAASVVVRQGVARPKRDRRGIVLEGLIRPSRPRARVAEAQVRLRARTTFRVDIGRRHGRDGGRCRRGSRSGCSCGSVLSLAAV
jgi:hypothetical protein